MSRRAACSRCYRTLRTAASAWSRPRTAHLVSGAAVDAALRALGAGRQANISGQCGTMARSEAALHSPDMAPARAARGAFRIPRFRRLDFFIPASSERCAELMSRTPRQPSLPTRLLPGPPARPGRRTQSEWTTCECWFRAPMLSGLTSRLWSSPSTESCCGFPRCAPRASCGGSERCAPTGRVLWTTLGLSRARYGRLLAGAARTGERRARRASTVARKGLTCRRLFFLRSRLACCGGGWAPLY